MSSPEADRPWLMLAVLSGACAAFNGVFAKITTTSLTASWAHTAAQLLHATSSTKAMEYAIRALFFVLNMTFNGVMWGLFTRALALSPSAIRVNVINTASNFLITALMGYLVFQENLPPLWFLGAGMLVAGSVIIGGRDGAQGNHEDDGRSTDNEFGTTSSAGGERGSVITSVAQDEHRGHSRKRKPPTSSSSS